MVPEEKNKEKQAKDMDAIVSALCYAPMGGMQILFCLVALLNPSKNVKFNGIQGLAYFALLLIIIFGFTSLLYDGIVMITYVLGGFLVFPLFFAFKAYAASYENKVFAIYLLRDIDIYSKTAKESAWA